MDDVSENIKSLASSRTLGGEDHREQRAIILEGEAAGQSRRETRDRSSVFQSESSS